MNKEIADYSWRLCWVRGKPSTEEGRLRFTPLKGFEYLYGLVRGS